MVAPLPSSFTGAFLEGMTAYFPISEVFRFFFRCLYSILPLFLNSDFLFLAHFPALRVQFSRQLVVVSDVFILCHVFWMVDLKLFSFHLLVLFVLASLQKSNEGEKANVLSP